MNTAKQTPTNNVRQLRESQLMSKAELARKAGLSPLTIDRVEGGKPCRMDTMRKIVLALGYKVGERETVFPGRLASNEDRPQAAGSSSPEEPVAGSTPAAAPVGKV